MLKNPAYCGERSLRETGGLVASLLNVAHWLRFRWSLLGRPSRFGLARLATAGVFRSLLVVLIAGRARADPLSHRVVSYEIGTGGGGGGGRLPGIVLGPPPG